MKELVSLGLEPRITLRRAGRPDPNGRCVVDWMQRSQRPFDNPALNTAIQAGNHLGKPVVVFIRLVPHSHHANLRHYYFLVQGLRDLESLGAGSLGRRDLRRIEQIF